ncbi:hypothetical protein ACU4GR_29015 [Methylobacterium oryzae CBMB20]
MDQFDAFRALSEFWTRAGAGFFTPGAGQAAPGFGWPTFPGATSRIWPPRRPSSPRPGLPPPPSRRPSRNPSKAASARRTRPPGRSSPGSSTRRPGSAARPSSTPP